jgi:UDP-galactopyranose mutase
MAAYLESVREKRQRIETSEDVVLNSVGRDLCDKFFRNYTLKQWGLELSQLSPAVAGRVPVRTNDDDRYFTDSFQCMPKDGFTAMFIRMLEHPLIHLELGQSFQQVRTRVDADLTFYSGPVDEYFDFCYGKLPYRSLRFEHQHYAEIGQYQPVAVVNYPNDFEYTRVTEFKHMTGQEHAGTSVVREFPQDGEDPYYPVPTARNQELYQRYKTLLATESNVHFVGRLAEYRYYNMDQVVAAALKLTSRFPYIGESDGSST